MRQDEIDLMISNYLAGEATGEEISALSRWVRESEENKRFFLEQRFIWQSLTPGFSPHEIDPDVALTQLLEKYPFTLSATEKIVTSLAESKTLSFSESKGSRRRYYSFLRYAAACLIPISLLLAYQNFIRKPGAVSYPVVLNVAYGGVTETALPDGTKVWLNSNSTLAYDIPFDTGCRQVRLTGEAYFEVSSDKSHPFVVTANDLEVIATGTMFNVNAYPNACNTATVTLVEGTIDIMVPSLSSSTTVSPGNVIRVDNCQFTVIDNNTSKFCSWKDGLLDFRNDSLGHIIDRLQQIYPVEFVVSDSSLLSQHYHAVFENETINEIIHLMELSGRLQFTPASSGRDIDSPHPGKQKFIVSHL